MINFEERRFESDPEAKVGKEVGKTDLVVVLPLKHNNPIVGGVGNDDPTLVVHGDTFARSEDS